MEIGAWLRSLGLERYEPAFRENEIDWEALPKLTAEDLKDLGVVLGGHRRRLLEAIAALDTAEAPLPAAAASASVGEAERRQLTVMFCDLVDYAEASACWTGYPKLASANSWSSISTSP
jgi:class 3 adenylate cyclase